MGLFGKMFGGGDPEAKARKAEAKAEREQQHLNRLLECALGNDPARPDADSRMTAALDLFLAEKYAIARDGYHSIVQDCPDRAGDMLGQVGACHHMQGEYEAAIEAYEAAIAAGGDIDVMQDNIRESREAMRAG